MSKHADPRAGRPAWLSKARRIPWLLALCLVMTTAAPAGGHADSRGTRLVIGGGVLGAIILNDLNADRERSTAKPARKATTSQSKTTTRKARSGSSGQSRVAAPAGEGKAKAAKPAVARESAPENAAAPVPTETGAIPAKVGPPAAAGAISTPGEIRAAQEHLKYLGYDVPAATGVMDLETRIAIMRFQESIGAPTTGALLPEQLQALFVKAAGQTAQRQ